MYKTWVAIFVLEIPLSGLLELSVQVGEAYLVGDRGWPPGAEGDLKPTAGKNTGTSVLPQQGNKFCQDPE